MLFQKEVYLPMKNKLFIILLCGFLLSGCGRTADQTEENVSDVRGTSTVEQENTEERQVIQAIEDTGAPGIQAEDIISYLNYCSRRNRNKGCHAVMCRWSFSIQRKYDRYSTSCRRTGQAGFSMLCS